MQRTELAVSQLSTFHHKNQWPQNSSNTNSVDYHVSKTVAELKESLQVIWGNLSQGPINKMVKDFSS